MFFVRRFKEDDIYDVFRIASESLTERYSLELLMDIYHSWPDGFLVAVSSDIIGFIAGSKYEKSARILMLAVDKNHRERGVGSALLNRFMMQCRAENISSITLEVRVNNRKAIEFYANRGFQIISMLDNYYTNGDSAYIMWKIL